MISELHIVCHQIRSADNLGAIARLLANFGFDRLTLSDPLTYAFRDAEKMAIRAETLLDRVQITSTLEEAIAPCVYACGTTSRTQLKRRKVAEPEEAIERLIEASARGPVALVFGGEKRGLSDEELSLCHDVLAIPTHERQPSMNLSQSVAVLLYLCARAAAKRDGQVREQPREPGAPLALVHKLEELMRDVLLRAEFLNPQAPEHVLGELSRSLVRAGLTRREGELWLSLFRHLNRHLTR